MIRHPVIKSIGDPAKQPKVARGPTQGQGNAKPPCRFCREVRTMVRRIFTRKSG